MRNRNTQSSWLLWLGFGGLLCLLAFAGLYGLSTIKSIGTRKEYIRTDYLRRGRILQQMRAELYLSGTYIRDLLLKPMQSKQNNTALRFAPPAIASNPVAPNTAASSALINAPNSRNSWRSAIVTSSSYSPPLTGLRKGAIALVSHS